MLGSVSRLMDRAEKVEIASYEKLGQDNLVGYLAPTNVLLSTKDSLDFVTVVGVKKARKKINSGRRATGETS